jgi:hypothetical protein
MTCNINSPIGDIAESVNKDRLDFIKKAETLDDVKDTFDFFNSNLEIKVITKEQLKNKKLAGIEDEIRVYNFKGTEVNLEETFTTQGKLAFIQKKGAEKAKEIQAKESSIFKRDTGTKIHRGIELLIPYMIKEKYADKFILPKHMSAKSLNEIKNDTDLSDQSITELLQMVDALLAQSVAIQKNIDPKAKMLISSEQKLMDKFKRGGTADLVVVYSNLNYSHYDFKTVYPNNFYLDRAGNIRDHSYLPYYKYDDWNLQIPKSNAALSDVVGLKKQIHSRIIPIQVTEVIENNNPTGRIKSIKTFVNNKDYLSQIPIQEKTHIQDLDEQVSKLNSLKTNAQLELDKKPEYSKQIQLKAKIETLTNAINKIIVDKDVSILIEDYTKLIKSFSKIEDDIVVGLSAKLTDKTQEDYISDSNYLNNLLFELNSFKTVLTVSQMYYKEIGLSDKEVKDYLNKIKVLSNNIDILIIKLREETFSRSNLDVDAVSKITPVSNISLMFDRFSQINHPIFIEAKRLLDVANAKKQVTLNKFKEELSKKTKDLEKWGVKNGLKGFEIFDKLIDDNTGNLYNKYSKEFNKQRNEALANKDAKFMSKYFIKKADADETFKRNKKRYIDESNLDEKNAKDKKKIDEWVEKNSPEALMFNRSFYRIYYELNPKEEESIYSNEYKYIKSQPELLEYYNFWTNSMRNFRWELGFGKDYDELPDNFVPWLRADIVEQFFTNGLSASLANFQRSITSIFDIQDDNTIKGNAYNTINKINPETGEEMHSIPKLFLNPLINKDGLIDKTLKSYDLSKSLYLFAEMAYNYQYMSQIEGNVNALSQMVQTQGVVLQNKDGKIIKTLGNAYSKVTGAQLDEAQAFKALVNYQMYGLRYQDRILGDKAKNIIQTAKQFQVAQQLAFSPITQTSAYYAAKANAYFEGVKGFYYNKEQFTNSNKIWTDLSSVGKYIRFTGEGLVSSIVGDSNDIDAVKYRALINFFNVVNKSKEHLSSELGSNDIKNLLDLDLGFLGFRKGSEKLDIIIFLSLMQNYGMSSDGKFIQLESLKKIEPEAKSLLNSIKVVNEKLVIPGIIDEKGDVNFDNFVKVKNLISSVSAGIKGEMTSEDMNVANTTLTGSLLMTYKNWLPTLIKERYGNTNYNPTTNTITIGKSNALWLNDIGNLSPESRNVLGILKHTLVISSKLLLDISTFGYFKQFKVNEERAAQLLQAFKNKHPGNKEIQNYSLDDYIRYMQGQIRSQIVELRMYSIFLMGLMLLGADWDDDDKPDYKETYLGRTMFRLTNRVTRELGFFYGSDALETFSKSSIPVTGLLFDFGKFLSNTVDVAVEDITGEEDKRDKSPRFYYFSKLFPGNKLLSVIETFEQDQKKEK